MNKLTEQQQKEAYRYMQQHEGESFTDIAAALSAKFGIAITGEECSSFYIDKLLG